MNDRRLAGWTGNGAVAMAAAPEYFVWWYTVKSLALVAAVAYVAYQAGKAASDVD